MSFLRFLHLARPLAALAFLLLCLSGQAQTDSTRFAEQTQADTTRFERQADTSRFAGLDRNIDAYIKAIEGESISTKIQEADFMTSSCDSGEVRNHVAIRLYDHYLNSPIMGDESVAVHMVDSWFVPGKASFANEIDLMNARIYSDFNRQSLIGCKAPSLRLLTPEGESVEVLGPSSRYRVLFIYDTGCTKCRLETILLRSMFRQYDYPLDFIALYAGDNEEAWEKYREENLDFQVNKTRIFHYWDPESESDFQRKYGVLQTPRMLLIAKDGTILGRNLDTQALISLLEIYVREPEHEYGSEESNELFSAIFPEGDRTMAADSVMALADYIADRTLVQLKDTLNFKQLTGDFLYYLVGKRGEAFRYGADYVAGSMVLNRPDIWSSPDDSLKVIGLAEMVSETVGKTPVGSRLPAIKVHGTMVTARGEKAGEWDLSRLSEGTYLLFHTKSCAVCKSEIEAGRRRVSLPADDGGIKKLLLVDVDEVPEDELKLLLDTFDLSSLPFALQAGKKGRVERKYFSLVEK